MVDSPSMLLALSAAMAFVAFGWLALAMDTHWQQVRGGSSATSAGPQKLLRVLGTLGLGVSALLSFSADTASMAALVWVMLLAVAGLLVAMTLAWRPALLRVLWPVGRA